LRNFPLLVASFPLLSSFFPAPLAQWWKPENKYVSYVSVYALNYDGQFKMVQRFVILGFVLFLNCIIQRLKKTSSWLNVRQGRFSIVLHY
jgi:hypothetical protein